MKPANRDYLERFRGHYEQYVKDRTLPKQLHIQQEDRKKFLHIAREEWDKNYAACTHCPHDFLILFKFCFVQMDKEIFPDGLDLIQKGDIIEPTITIEQVAEPKEVRPKKNNRREK